MRVVLVKAVRDSSLAAAVLLLDDDLNEVLALHWFPKPNMQNKDNAPAKRPIALEDVRTFYGNRPVCFVSPYMQFVTTSFWAHDLPCIAVIDSATGKEFIMDIHGYYLGVDSVAGKFYYKDCPGFNSQFTSKAQANNQPLKFKLQQNYPNPFNPETLISFDLAKPGHVKLEVYNITGRKVMTLIDENRQSGHHEVTWNGINSQGTEVASGIYFYKLKFGGEIKTLKMVLIR